jgi:solute carrier family 25 (mitochondrial folate transporter), member 32
MTAQDAGLSAALVETISGLTAGCVATLVVHPLDVVKTRMQLQRGGRGRGRGPSTPPSLDAISTMRSLTQTSQPLRALYRGLAPNLVGNATAWASFFLLKARLEHGAQALRRQHQHQDQDQDQDQSQAEAGLLGPADYFVASGLAGMGVCVLTNPVWVLKTRMLSSDRGAAGAYPTMLSGAARLWRAEGWRGFYRGLGISLFGVSHGAVQFAVYDPLKRVYLGRHHRPTPGTDDGPVRMGNGATLLLSSVSKLVAGAATYPYQAIRSRMQTYDAEERFGRGIRGVIRSTWTDEGLRGFYRGIVPGVVRVLPATWVTFLVYENVKFYLPRWAT